MSELNADFSKRVVMRTAQMDWQASPSAGVWRKRLELAGDVEKGRVTSVVRYDAGSAFAPHDHPEGEEFLVLDGVFSDEHGDYPAGSYLLNPRGFRHAPRSTPGCTIFVKLRQYAGPDRPHLNIDTAAAHWQPGTAPGHAVLPLYQGGDDYPESIRLVRFDPGFEAPDHTHPGGEEIYVVEGTLEDEDGRYAAGDWLRLPPGSRHRPRSPDGCLIYVKSGHLPPGSPTR